VKKYFEAGLGIRDIAIACGISTQATYQHLHRLRRDGELPEVNGQ
jgi:transposase-like protein